MTVITKIIASLAVVAALASPASALMSAYPDQGRTPSAAWFSQSAPPEAPQVIGR